MSPDLPTSPPAMQFTFGDNTNIRADVFGGNKYETNIYLLRAATGPPDWRVYRDLHRAPYRFLDSYDLLDAAIYTGREADVERLEGEVLTHRLVVLQGPVGVGKTSLLQAGLTPRLLARGYLVLAVQSYVDPLAALRSGLDQARHHIEIDLSQATDLSALVRAAQDSLARPVVLILEHFESFFSDPRLNAAGRERLRDMLADFRTAAFRYPASLIISIRQQAQGQLVYFQPAIPDIFHHVVALDLLTPSQARRAILAPLDGLQPPMVFDPRFLDERLLPDLATAGREDGAIDPPHLQIVCKALYDEARARGRQIIDADLYDRLGGKRGTLGSYVERTLSEEFPDAGRYDLARRLLKAMASPSGATTSLSLSAAAEQTGQPPHVVLDVLETLVRRSLIAVRAEQSFSLAHPAMVETVLRWFDRQEAEVRCAQDMLDRAWYDWLAWERMVCGDLAGNDSTGRDVARNDSATATRRRPAPLLSAARLPEVAACWSQLRIEPGQYALLLGSAAAAGADATIWVKALAQDEMGCCVVRDLQEGDAPAGRRRSAEQFARVLGIGESVHAANALGRAVIGPLPGAVRRAAAWALAALGADAVAQAFWPEGHGRRTPAQNWRLAQALAAMRAAGCRLPELPSLWLRIAVTFGDRIARWRAGRQAVAVEALGAALGAGLAYALRVAMMMLLAPYPAAHPYLLALAAGISAASLGFLLGGITVLLARFIAPVPHPGEPARPAWQTVSGITLGFILGQAAALPAEFAYASNFLPGPTHLIGRYVIGGGLLGLGMAIGFVWGERTGGRRSALASAVGGAALAGALIGALNWTTPQIGLPNLTTAGGPLPTIGQFALSAALLAAGLVGGWLLAQRIWWRWQMRAVGLLFGRADAAD
ncbi:MAG: hypothetical protein N2439_07725, partial [Anaerolineae bacterium]|nr:hypothetical protein [Anaerolineae bacterium]